MSARMWMLVLAHLLILVAILVWQLWRRERAPIPAFAALDLGWLAMLPTLALMPGNFPLLGLWELVYLSALGILHWREYVPRRDGSGDRLLCWWMIAGFPPMILWYHLLFARILKGYVPGVEVWAAAWWVVGLVMTVMDSRRAAREAALDRAASEGQDGWRFGG